LQLLLNALPQHRESLRELIAQEYAGFFAGNDAENTQEVEDIPSSFYVQALEAYTTSSSYLRFSTVLTLIVQKMLPHFDPTGSSGIQITVAQCIPSNEQDQHIHSLREIMHRTTPPLSSLEPQTMLLGVESLIGYAVMRGHIVVEQDLVKGQSLLPASDIDITIERSAAACPIKLGGGLAGGVMVSSSQPHYFTALRLSLIQNYTQLLTLAFDPSDFYPLDKFELRIMPAYQQQKPYLQLLSTRTRQILLDAVQQKKSITSSQAEAIAWQEIEQKLLELPADYPAQKQEQRDPGYV